MNHFLRNEKKSEKNHYNTKLRARYTCAQTNDILQFSNGGSVTVTNVPNQGIGGLVVNGTNVTLQPGAASNLLTISGSAPSPAVFSITSGNTLTIGDGSNAFGIAFSGTAANNVANINGTLTTTAFGSFNTTNSTTTISSTGVVNNTGTFTATTGTCTFGAGSNYFHKQNGGTMPLATYNASSTITADTWGASTTNPFASSNNIGNLVWNSSSQTGSINFANNVTAITGSLTVTNTGSGAITLASTSMTLPVSGNVAIDGGTLRTSASTVGIALNITGNLNVNSGTLDMGTAATNSPAYNVNVAGSFNLGSAGNIAKTGAASSTQTIAFNGASQQAVTFTAGGTVTNPISFSVNNGSNGINLTGIMPINQSATLTINNAPSFTGSTGNVSYNQTASTLVYSGTVAQTTTDLEWPTTNGPVSVTINNTTTTPNNKLTLNSSKKVNVSYT
ncbi:MAG: hypothetical protein ACOVOV_12600, partial [Dolichospermum sp.]